MSQPDSKHDRLWQLIDEAQAETDHKIANRIFCNAEQLGRELHDREPADAEHCYAIALTYYHRWDSPLERRKCVEWLDKTEQLNPTHPWVPLYLGYQFMDDQRYSDAIGQFSRVNQTYFASIEHHWRNIKTDELILVAFIRNGSTDIDTTRLVRLADRYANAEQVDQPIPTEIVKTLAMAENRDRFDTPAHNIASEVCRLIHACGDTNVFPNELAELETAAKIVG
ncbi:hypothetical protein RMSM_03952 [Rhodopirellula maiorica SM1]|uniref:Uncharacterized protein n=1 Tax=Rhodopirellula maiorica SM1 TaxID=1265738 RepID=M5RYW3_9BACT|nr:hypothetical protein [Rhodopirellula maiorica]EMI19119.1 hypothetical protein RMSM_03952 [Rhodopirellula maiorica SM1]